MQRVNSVNTGNREVWGLKTVSMVTEIQDVRRTELNHSNMTGMLTMKTKKINLPFIWLSAKHLILYYV